jgi:hypothetical protein
MPLIGIIVNSATADGSRLLTINGSLFGTTQFDVSAVYASEDGVTYKTCTIVSWSGTVITAQVPAGIDPKYVKVNGSDNTMSAPYYNAYYLFLDRYSIGEIVAARLRADTTSLYGSSNMIQCIETDPVKFSKSSVDKHNPFKIFVWASIIDEEAPRASNVDEIYALNFRIEGMKVDIKQAVKIIDDSVRRISYLLNEEMFNGNMLTSYYSPTFAGAQIFDIQVNQTQIPIPAPTGDGVLIAECEGAITIRVNRTF